MRYLLAFLGGFLLTLLIFAGGAGFAVVYLTAEPVPVHRPNAGNASVAQASEPVRVVGTSSGDRRASDPEAAFEAQTTLGQSGSGKSVDPTTTASVDPTPGGQEKIEAAHIAWCLKRYRSYNVQDNRYTTYSGERRECISPVSEGSRNLQARDEVESVIGVSSGETPALGNALHTDDPGVELSPEHIRSCFARYRSYRPDDNTYQPYGGGPRRQCR